MNDTIWLILEKDQLTAWADALAQLATTHVLRLVMQTPAGHASFPPVFRSVHQLVDMDWSKVANEGAFVVGSELSTLLNAQASGARVALWHQAETPPPASVLLAFADPQQLVFGLRRERGLPVRYRVTATAIHEKVAREFIKWMEFEHGPELVAAPGCLEFRVFRLDPARVSCEYLFENRAALDRYLEVDAPKLRLKGRERFPEHLMTFERHDDELIVQGFKSERQSF